MNRRLCLNLCALLLGFLFLGCSANEGEGEVRSENLNIRNCWTGAFDLDPTFFGANPYRNTLTIRIQRGDNIEEVSDGLIVLVNNVAETRKSLLGFPQPVGLPVGVTPPGVPVSVNPNPPKVHLALYLHDTCHNQNGTLYSMDGDITFHSLFSGDPNEGDADDRYTDAEFDATFADPRDARADGSFPPGVTSRVTGWFRFFFERGQPAQPFP